MQPPGFQDGLADASPREKGSQDVVEARKRKATDAEGASASGENILDEDDQSMMSPSAAEKRAQRARRSQQILALVKETDKEAALERGRFPGPHTGQRAAEHGGQDGGECRGCREQGRRWGGELSSHALVQPSRSSFRTRIVLVI